MENKIIKCISFDIYEDKQIGNCSNDGISNRFNDVLIPCEDGYITVDLDNPPENLCKVVKRYFPWLKSEYVHIEPYAAVKEGNVGYMSGGSVVYSCDSRYSEAVGVNYPVCLHDRQETQEQYDFLTRD